MNKMASTIISGVAIAVLSAGAMGLFNLHTDVKLLQAHSHSTDAALRANHEAGKEFMKTLGNINATLAAQTEAINNLKEAVRRNDPGYVLALSPIPKESYNDSGN